MKKNYKRIVKTYFSFTKYWFIGMLLLTVFVIALAAAMIYYGEFSRIGKAIWIVAIPIISLYQSFHMIPFWFKCKKDLKNGEIATKRITVDNIGMDVDHNYAVKGSRVVGRMKYAIVDTDGDFYYIYPSKGKKMVLDNVIEGKSIDVTYLKNTFLVLEMQFDFRDEANPVYVNFKKMFAHYFASNIY